MAILWRSKERKELKRWHLGLLLVMIGAALLYKLYGIWHEPTARVSIADTELFVRLAHTPALRYRGWSKAKDMGKFQGLLFIFPERGQHAMVMRDMNFPLDIIWIDNGAIVDMAPQVEPEPGKSRDQLTPYLARAPSTLVLELPAGFVQDHDVKIGDTVKIISAAP